jgi:hypothetical protein
MGTFQEAKWRPVFPDPGPARWVAFASTEDGLLLLSDDEIDSRRQAWLAKWLAAHSVREPDEEASYIYLGLDSDWSRVAPDGTARSGGVVGFGSGVGFGEPPGASPSRVSEIVRHAIAELLDGSGL